MSSQQISAREVSAPLQQYLTPSNISMDDAPLNVEALVAKMQSNIEVKDRKYHLATYKSVFLGSDAVEWMLQVSMLHVSYISALKVTSFAAVRCHLPDTLL
jgi:hypothetical protein